MQYQREVRTIIYRKHFSVKGLPQQKFTFVWEHCTDKDLKDLDYNMHLHKSMISWRARAFMSSSFPTTSSKRIAPFSRVTVTTENRCECTHYRNLSTATPNYSKRGDGLITSATLGQETMPLSVNVVEYIESVQQSGNVAVLFSDAPFVLWTVEALCFVKDLPGMSWISTIICGTLCIRAIVGVPIAIAQNKAMARLENLKPELKQLGEDLKMETAMAVKKFKWDEKTTRRQFTKSYKKHWRSLVEKNNCHPMKSLALSLTQLPFWICFSSALRNVVYAVPLPRTSDKMDRWLQIHNEGTPWVESLVVPDPVVFPAIFLAMNLMNVEFNRKQRLQTMPETKLQKILPWVFRGGMIAIAFIATSVPSAVSMYWATSSALAFAQNVVLASPAVKMKFQTSASSSSSNVQKSKR